PNTTGEEDHLALRSQVGGDGVFNFFLRLQDRALIITNQRLETCILHPNVVLDAPIVEDRPTKARTAKVFQAAAFEEIIEIFSSHTNSAKQGEPGKEVSLGNTDLRALGRKLTFGPANVRTPAQQVGRNADGDLCWRTGYRLCPPEHMLEILRRNAQE